MKKKEQKRAQVNEGEKRMEMKDFLTVTKNQELRKDFNGC
jgi:hypothetical protein